MLNCDIIKLETFVNLSLLILIMATISCLIEASTAYSVSRILLEISLEVLTTIVFLHTFVWSIFIVAENNCSVNWQSNEKSANLQKFHINYRFNF